MYPFCIYIYITYAHLYFSQDCHVPYDNHPSSASFPFCGARIFSPAVNGTIATPPPFPRVFCSPPSFCFFFLREAFFPPSLLLLLPRMFGCSDARDHTVPVPSPSPIDLPPSTLLLPPFFSLLFPAPRPERGRGARSFFSSFPCPCPPKRSNYVTSRPELSGRACTPPPPAYNTCIYIRVFLDVSRGAIRQRCNQLTPTSISFLLSCALQHN